MSESAQHMDIQLDDCWNRIGVWGSQQPRCEKLATHVHCRNCEVYSDAGRRILERRLPEEYESSWATIYAKQKVHALVGTESNTIFRLGSEWMAMPTNMISEITEIQPIHSIPHRQNPILRGLVNLRGQLRICISLGHLLGIEKTEQVSQTESARVYNRMLNIRNGADEYVFVVTEVKDTYRLDPASLVSAPATISKASGSLTRGMIKWNGLDVACLDSELLFYSLANNVS